MGPSGLQAGFKCQRCDLINYRIGLLSNLHTHTHKGQSMDLVVPLHVLHTTSWIDHCRSNTISVLHATSWIDHCRTNTITVLHATSWIDHCRSNTISVLHTTSGIDHCRSNTITVLHTTSWIDHCRPNTDPLLFPHAEALICLPHWLTHLLQN